MDLEIVSKDENQLLDRTEVRFKATHADEGTPQRDAVREKLASLLKVPKERVVVDSMRSEFGKMETLGYAKVYKTKEAAVKYEREHILVRNKLKERASKAKETAAAGKAESAADSKAEEKSPKEKPGKDKEEKKEA
ncbi:MAG: 30S ribosomal protein S24e [Methanobacteriota archaeon]|nr:MAG: 30S ribosomal protein S24e [Euryarchaeota archaeon]